MSIDQRAALDRVPDADLMVSRTELAAALHDPPDVDAMSTVRLSVYLVATIAATVIAAIVWSATH
jgi:hypothetical protein